MGWLLLWVWIGVVVVAAVVLGFCAYELTWKARRLQTDLKRLTGLAEKLGAIQIEVQSAQRRLADVEL